MQDDRICSATAAQTNRVERAILILLLAEDHPWRLEGIGRKLAQPTVLLAACVARLQADGLLERKGDTLRASRAAVRADELTLYTLRPWKR